MKLKHLILLLSFFGAASFQSSCQSPAAQEEAPATTSVQAPAPRRTMTQEGVPPAQLLTEEVRRSGKKWALPTEREQPVTCNFTLYIEGANLDTLKLLGVYANENYLAGFAPRGKDGGYTFKKEGGYLGGLYFAFLGPQEFFQFLVDEDQEFVMRTRKGDLINSMKVEGSVDNELLYRNMQFEGAMQPQFEAVERKIKAATEGTPAYQQAKAEQDALVAKRKAHIDAITQEHPQSFFSSFKLSGQNPIIDPPLDASGKIDNPLYYYQYRMAFWDGVDFGDGRLLRTPVLHNKLERYVKDLTPRLMDSLVVSAERVSQMALYGHPEIFKHVVNYLGVNYKQPNIMGGEAVYVNTIDKYFTQQLAFWEDSLQLVRLRNDANLMKASLLGQIGQDVKAKDRNGQYHSLYEINAPYTVVFIYSAECEHCQEETPKLKKVYEEWKPKGLEVFGICQDPDVELWEKFLDRFQLPWVNVIDPKYESGYYKKYHMDVLPELYVLDKNHKIIAKNLKPEQLPVILKKEMGIE